MQAWVDSRFDAVGEDRRRELFEMYRAMVADEAALPPTAVQVREASDAWRPDCVHERHSERQQRRRPRRQAMAQAAAFPPAALQGGGAHECNDVRQL